MKEETGYEIFCQECFAYIPGDSLFCPSCGFKIGLSSPEKFKVTDKLVKSAEKRWITSLFLHLREETKGKTPIEIFHISEKILIDIDSILKEQGAYIEKWLGVQGLLAIFGIPVVKKDDAKRGAESALKIKNYLIEVNSKLKKSDGILFNWGIGLHLGWVFFGKIAPRNYQYSTVIGDAVNTTYRLSRISQNQILISDRMSKTIEKNFIFHRKGLHELKGKRHRIIVFELKEKRTEKEEKKIVQIPFVGRTMELEILNSRLQALYNKEGGVLVFTGEGGIGKTALKNKWLLDLRKNEKITIFEGGEVFGNNIPYSPFIQGLVKLFDRNIEKGILQTLPEIKNEVPVFKNIIQGVEESNLDPQAKLHRIRMSFLALFRNLILKKPLVCIFDSIEKYCEVSLNLLNFLVSSFGRQCLFIILGRENYLTQNNIKPEEIFLKPLSREDVKIFIKELFDTEPPAEILEKIYTNTQGIPLYLTEFIRSIRKRDIALDSEEIFPPSLIGYLLESFENMEENDKKVLSTLSILGEWDSEGPLKDFLDERERVQFLCSEGYIQKFHTLFSFVNPLFREVIYQTIFKSEKLPVHRKVVERFKENDQKERFYPYIFYHAYQGEIWRCAFEFAMLSARQRFQEFSNRDALHYLLKAEECLERCKEKTPRDIGMLYLEKGRVKKVLGHIEEAIKDIHRALVVLEGEVDKEELGYIRAELADLYFEKGDIFNAKRIYLNNFETSEILKSSGLSVLSHLGLGRVNQYLGHLPSALMEYNKAYLTEKQEKERNKVYPPLSDIALSLARLHIEAGNFEMSLSYLQNAEENCVSQEDYFRLIHILETKAECLIKLGNFQKALQTVKKGSELAYQLGNEIMKDRFTGLKALIYAYTGNETESISTIENIKRIETGNLDFHFSLLRAQVYFLLNRRDELQGLFKTLLKYENIANKKSLFHLYLMLASVDTEKGQEFLNKAMELYKNIPAPLEQLRLYIAYAQHWTKLRNKREAINYTKKAVFILKELEDRITQEEYITTFLLHPDFKPLHSLVKTYQIG